MMHVLFRGVETQLHFSTRCNETGNLLRVPISREIRYGSVNENPFSNSRRFNFMKFHSRYDFWKAGSRPSLKFKSFSDRETFNISQQAFRDTCYQLDVIRIHKRVKKLRSSSSSCFSLGKKNFFKKICIPLKRITIDSIIDSINFKLVWTVDN